MANDTTYGELPKIARIEIIDGDVLFWFVGDDDSMKTYQDFPSSTPTGIWLREIVEKLLLDEITLYHGYGCPNDGQQMTEQCLVCEQFDKENPF